MGPAKINGEYENLVAATAICHDIGHSPFSHDIENLISEYSGMDHEAVSAALIAGDLSLVDFYSQIPEGVLPPGLKRARIRKWEQMNTIPDVLRAYGVSPDTVAEIIDGSRAGDTPLISDYHFLREIIDGKIIDADKFDYLQRDPNMSGIDETRFKPTGIMSDIGIVQDHDGHHIAIADTSIPMVNQMLGTREYMYTNCYTHKTALRAQAMVYEATKRFLHSIQDELQREAFGKSIQLLDEEQFESLLTSRDLPIVEELLETAVWDRQEMHRYAFEVQYSDVPLPTAKQDTEEGRLLDKLFEINTREKDGESFIRDLILARVNAGATSLEDHDIIVYFPYPRQRRTLESCKEKFSLHVYNHRDPSLVYNINSYMQESNTNTDSRVESLFSTYCRHQTSRYFTVLASPGNEKIVHEATVETMNDLLNQ
jgi:HD superfamily phosphohydrolase